MKSFLFVLLTLIHPLAFPADPELERIQTDAAINNLNAQINFPGNKITKKIEFIRARRHLELKHKRALTDITPFIEKVFAEGKEEDKKSLALDLLDHKIMAEMQYTPTKTVSNQAITLLTTSIINNDKDAEKSAARLVAWKNQEQMTVEEKFLDHLERVLVDGHSLIDARMQALRLAKQWVEPNARYSNLLLHAWNDSNPATNNLARVHLFTPTTIITPALNTSLLHRVRSTNLKEAEKALQLLSYWMTHQHPDSDLQTTFNKAAHTVLIEAINHTPTTRMALLLGLKENLKNSDGFLLAKMLQTESDHKNIRTLSEALSLVGKPSAETVSLVMDLLARPQTSSQAEDLLVGWYQRLVPGISQKAEQLATQFLTDTRVRNKAIAISSRINNPDKKIVLLQSLFASTDTESRERAFSELKKLNRVGPDAMRLTLHALTKPHLFTMAKELLAQWTQEQPYTFQRITHNFVGIILDQSNHDSVKTEAFRLYKGSNQDLYPLDFFELFIKSKDPKIQADAFEIIKRHQAPPNPLVFNQVLDQIETGSERQQKQAFELLNHWIKNPAFPSDYTERSIDLAYRLIDQSRTSPGVKVISMFSTTPHLALIHIREQIVKIAKDENTTPSEKISALYTLGRMKHPEYESILAHRALSHPDFTVFYSSLRRLRDIARPRSDTVRAFLAQIRAHGDDFYTSYTKEIFHNWVKSNPENIAKNLAGEISRLIVMPDGSLIKLSSDSRKNLFNYLLSLKEYMTDASIFVDIYHLSTDKDIKTLAQKAVLNDPSENIFEKLLSYGQQHTLLLENWLTVHRDKLSKPFAERVKSLAQQHFKEGANSKALDLLATLPSRFLHEPTLEEKPSPTEQHLMKLFTSEAAHSKNPVSDRATNLLAAHNKLSEVTTKELIDLGITKPEFANKVGWLLSHYKTDEVTQNTVSKTASQHFDTHPERTMDFILRHGKLDSIESLAAAEKALGFNTDSDVYQAGLKILEAYQKSHSTLTETMRAKLITSDLRPEFIDALKKDKALTKQNIDALFERLNTATFQTTKILIRILSDIHYSQPEVKELIASQLIDKFLFPANRTPQYIEDVLVAIDGINPVLPTTLAKLSKFAKENVGTVRHIAEGGMRKYESDKSLRQGIYNPGIRKALGLRTFFEKLGLSGCLKSLTNPS